jgi:hypothetical protein
MGVNLQVTRKQQPTAPTGLLEGALFRVRYPAGAALLFLIAVDALSIAWTVLSGRRSPVPLSVQVTFQDEAQLLLALGTLALAYAASLQALSTKHQAESAKRAILASQRPLLGIKLLEPSGPLDLDRQRAMAQPQVAPLFVTEVKERTELRFVLTNMGPGNATEVTVRGPYLTLDSHGPWLKDEFIPQTPGTEVPETGSVFLVVDGWAMQANERLEFNVPVAIPTPKDTGAANGTYEVLAGVDLIAECRDVEGNIQRPVIVSARLHQVLPFTYRTAFDIAAGTYPGTGRGYRLLWGIVSSQRGTGRTGGGHVVPTLGA